MRTDDQTTVQPPDDENVRSRQKMSTEATFVVPAIAAGNSQLVPAIATDDVNAHTPDPHVPGEERIPEVPTPQGEGIEELREVVATLATAVATLTDLVTGTLHDESPQKVPWTHLGGHLPHADED
jgi:hypothetical protein